jgi:2-polyprenyl-3-methyl-5-hydroxy-6-metoxy-1,4-benzoquinol methylase
LLGPHPSIKKHFDNTTDGRACFHRELEARRLFGDRPWIVPGSKRGVRTIAMPCLPEERRLDWLAGQMDSSTRAEVARQAVEILWEIFGRGYAHRDFHAGNLYWIDGCVMVTDFETLERYPDNDTPPFPESYDMTGKGLRSPFATSHMSYGSSHPRALQQVLGMSAEGALSQIRNRLKESLHDASLDFRTQKSRHRCNAKRIYASFRLPYLEVTPKEAQRNSERRIENFDMRRELFEGRSLLDLGSNVGGMVFEIQKFDPSRTVGIEYDQNKVTVARHVVKYTGIKGVRFEQLDIDTLTLEQLGGKYDVVFCLAIEKHVRKPARLYDLLARITSERLYFEGNAGTDVSNVMTHLRNVGFRNIEYLGYGDDDCLPENNIRPLIRASRR